MVDTHVEEVAPELLPPPPPVDSLLHSRHQRPRSAEEEAEQAKATKWYEVKDAAEEAAAVATAALAAADVERQTSGNASASDIGSNSAAGAGVGGGGGVSSESSGVEGHRPRACSDDCANGTTGVPSASIA
jgi:hypothetical protein